jgi:hypothetical protein
MPQIIITNKTVDPVFEKLVDARIELSRNQLNRDQATQIVKDQIAHDVRLVEEAEKADLAVAAAAKGKKKTD